MNIKPAQGRWVISRKSLAPFVRQKAGGLQSSVRSPIPLLYVLDYKIMLNRTRQKSFILIGRLVGRKGYYSRPAEKYSAASFIAYEPW